MRRRPSPFWVSRLLEVDEVAGARISLLLEAVEHAARGAAVPGYAWELGEADLRRLASHQRNVDDDARRQELERIVSERGGIPNRSANTEDVLREAARVLRAVRPELDRCASLSAVLEAVLTFCSERLRDFRFSSEEGIEIPRDAPACPPPHHRYEGFSDVSMPRELVWGEDANLKDDAILPLLRTLSLTPDGLGVTVDPAERAEVLLRRYGSRCLGCTLKILADPWSFTLADPSLATEVLRERLLTLASDWPDEAMLVVFRAVIRAGWLDKIRHVPAGAVRHELEREMARSPYRPSEGALDMLVPPRPRQHPPRPRMVAIPTRGEGALVVEVEPRSQQVTLSAQDYTSRERTLVLDLDQWKQLRAAFRLADSWIREGLKPGTERRVNQVPGLVTLDVLREADGNWWIRIQFLGKAGAPPTLVDIQANHLRELRNALILIDRVT